MATSPIYGWAEPDNTDLVKNGALAIRTLGNAIDTTMGTMTPKSTYTAKGSIAAATAASTPANLAVGNNGEVLVADSNTSTGLRYQVTQAAGKNGLINGLMEIAQRGTAAITLTAAAFSYPVDRWFAARNSGTTGATAQQISSIGLTGFNNALRIQRTVGDTSTQRLYMGQSFETVNSIPFAGQAVTLSFYARAGANLSSNLAVRLYTGTGTDQSGLGTAFTGTATPISQSQALTTTWTRYQFTATLATSATQIQAFFFIDPTGTAGAADNFDITGVQLELGSIATNFSRAGSNLGGELALCQRYYYRVYPNTSGRYSTGQCTATTTATFWMPYPVTMRTTPTALEQSGTATDYRLQDLAGNGVTCSSVPVFQIATTAGGSSVFTVATGIVAGNGTIGFAANANSYLGWSAEL